MSLDTINFKVPLPPIPKPHDVVHRKLRITYDDPNTPDEEMRIPLEVRTVEGMSVPQDVKVVLTLTHIDDSGNESEPTVYEFTAKDNVPPPAPGQFGVIVESETHAAIPADPAPEDMPPEAPVTPEIDPDEPEAPEDTPADAPEDASVGDEPPLPVAPAPPEVPEDTPATPEDNPEVPDAGPIADDSAAEDTEDTWEDTSE